MEDKEKQVIQIRALKQALNHGLKLINLHRVIKINQRAWLKAYIDLNSQKKKKKQKMNLKKISLS